MKTLLFAPCFLDEGDRLERNLKWLDYVKDLKDLKYDHILLVDNCSSQEKLNKIIEKHPNISIVSCPTNLPRLQPHGYGYWYRAFRVALEFCLVHGFERIVHIDTDVYILNKRLTDYLNNLETGWTGMYCKMHNFPETTVQVICKDNFESALTYFTEGFLKFYPYDMAETTIPWTHVEKGFKGDRYGERELPQTPDMEWYGQCPVSIKMTYNVNSDS